MMGKDKSIGMGNGRHFFNLFIQKIAHNATKHNIHIIYELILSYSSFISGFDFYFLYYSSGVPLHPHMNSTHIPWKHYILR